MNSQVYPSAWKIHPYFTSPHLFYAPVLIHHTPMVTCLAIASLVPGALTWAEGVGGKGLYTGITGRGDRTKGTHWVYIKSTHNVTSLQWSCGTDDPFTHRLAPSSLSCWYQTPNNFETHTSQPISVHLVQGSACLIDTIWNIQKPI